MKHRAAKRFWNLYGKLPEEVRTLADANFKILKSDPRHPSLHFKRVDDYWSVRVGIHYRALAIQQDNDVVWFWIGHHAEYDRIISTR